MNRKNDVQVVINGRRFNIAGEEDVEYLEKVAEYLNKKQIEINQQRGSNIINDSEKNILMMINLADDYLKLQKSYENLQHSLELKQKEVEFVRRDLNQLKDRIEKYENGSGRASAEDSELQKKIIKL